jgi:hypothetical protein
MHNLALGFLLVVEAMVVLLRVSIVLFVAKHTSQILYLHDAAYSGWAVDVGAEAAVLLTHQNPSSHRGRG